jgi:hypothetical protein
MVVTACRLLKKAQQQKNVLGESQIGKEEKFVLRFLKSHNKNIFDLNLVKSTSIIFLNQAFLIGSKYEKCTHLINRYLKCGDIISDGEVNKMHVISP